jgi:glycine cleavage system aminomethyltransferase T
MPKFSLEDKIQQAGNPALMLRTAPVGPYPLPFAAEYSNWRDEQAAWANASVLFDQSFHMTDIFFRGPDVKRLLSDVGVNSFKNFGPGKAKQLVTVNYDGQVIADAIVFGWAEDNVSIVGSGVAGRWTQFHAETGDYKVDVTVDPRSVDNPDGRSGFRFQLNGPRTHEVIEKAASGPVESIKFFSMGTIRIAGCDVKALNHTMAGVPGREMTGLELMGPAEHGQAVKDALLAAGDEFGLVLGGALSYGSTPVEGGWIPLPTAAIYTGDKMRPYRQWLDGYGFEAFASIGGSFTSDNIEDYYVLPWDLGYGKSIKFDHDFIGREALEDLQDRPHRQKVWLRWNDEDVIRVVGSSLFGGERRAKYLDFPYAQFAVSQYDQVLSGDRMVGVSTWNGYTVNIGGYASLAMVDEADARDGSEVIIAWGEEGAGIVKPTIESNQVTGIRATLHTSPLI